MIAVHSWSPAVALGQPGVATFVVQADRPVVRLEVDLLGDGDAPPTVVTGDDLRAVVALQFTPRRAGRFSLQVRALDAAGCADATGRQRDVEVRP